MMNIHAVSALAGLALLAACAESPTAPLPNDIRPSLVVATAAGPSASGAGHITTCALRGFSFTAVTQTNGRVTGAAELDNRCLGVRYHVAVSCLVVVGNTAYMGGIITSASDPSFVGQNQVFAAQDNGEGGNAPPDLLSGSLSAFDPTITCDNPAFQLTPSLPTDGSIQVRP